MSKPKYKVGDIVEVINYGHRLWATTEEARRLGMKIADDTPDIVTFDINPGIVGKTGVITEVSTTQDIPSYALSGIPEKVAWYSESQLKLKTMADRYNIENEEAAQDEFAEMVQNQRDAELLFKYVMSLIMGRPLNKGDLIKIAYSNSSGYVDTALESVWLNEVQRVHQGFNRSMHVTTYINSGFAGEVHHLLEDISHKFMNIDSEVRKLAIVMLQKELRKYQELLNAIDKRLDNDEQKEKRT